MTRELKTVKLLFPESGSTPEAALAWARENLDAASAWFLAEAPAAVFFERLERLPETESGSFASLRIFARNGEIRLEKNPGCPEICARAILEDAGGEEYYCRETAYFIREKIDGNHARLICREYFQPNESGFLVKQCERLTGVTSDGAE